MNTPASDGGLFGNSNNAGYSYGIGVSVGILILITTITLASYFCTRADTQTSSHGGAEGQRRPRLQQQQRQPQSQPQEFVIDIGIDEATLHTYPKLLYSKANLSKKDSTATCCSICLADYKSKDVLRLLPDCNHIFHLRCVDPWLRLHPTCPVCRTSPLPTPQSTPLAEVVPLAASRLS